MSEDQGHPDHVSQVPNAVARQGRASGQRVRCPNRDCAAIIDVPKPTTWIEAVEQEPGVGPPRHTPYPRAPLLSKNCSPPVGVALHGPAAELRPVPLWCIWNSEPNRAGRSPPIWSGARAWLIGSLPARSRSCSLCTSRCRRPDRVVGPGSVLRQRQ